MRRKILPQMYRALFFIALFFPFVAFILVIGVYRISQSGTPSSDSLLETPPFFLRFITTEYDYVLARFHEDIAAYNVLFKTLEILFIFNLLTASLRVLLGIASLSSLDKYFTKTPDLKHASKSQKSLFNQITGGLILGGAGLYVMTNINFQSSVDVLRELMAYSVSLYVALQAFLLCFAVWFITEAIMRILWFVGRRAKVHRGRAA